VLAATGRGDHRYTVTTIITTVHWSFRETGSMDPRRRNSFDPTASTTETGGMLGVYTSGKVELPFVRSGESLFRPMQYTFSGPKNLNQQPRLGSRNTLPRVFVDSMPQRGGKLETTRAVTRHVSMDEQALRKEAHDLDVTVWVGKSGIDAVVGELSDQLDERDLVKVRFHRSAVGGTSTEDVAADLAEAASAELIETRGNTAVYYR
jgi:RNA-binding protein